MSKEDQLAITKFRERLASGQKTSKVFYEPKNTVEKIKKDLCRNFIEICDRLELKQKEIALLSDSTTAQISEIINYRIERFTIDFLVEKLETMEKNLKANAIDIKIEYPTVRKISRLK